MSKILAFLTALGFAVGLLVGGAAVANAACSSTMSDTFNFYKDSNCNGASFSLGGGFNYNNSFGNAGEFGNNELSSVNLKKVNSNGSARVRLYDGLNRVGQLVGLTNATNSGKNWNLSDLNVNDKTNSSCSDRVIGSWDPALCSITG